MANDNLLSIVEAEMREGSFAEDREFDNDFHYYVDSRIFEEQGGTYASKKAAIEDMKETIKGLEEYISSLVSLKESCESNLESLEEGEFDDEWDEDEDEA